MMTIQQLLSAPLFAVSLVFITACNGIPENQVDRYQFDDISDDDFDGVINARDICSQTPVNVVVDSEGCTDWNVREKIDFVSFEFGFDNDAVPETAKSGLKRLADQVSTNDDYSITIIGDTSPEGSLRYNAKLAYKRAEAVEKQLKSFGVPSDKIDVHYFTEDVPIVGEFMKERRHRVVALLHSPDYQHVPAWNIFSSENALKRRGK